MAYLAVDADGTEVAYEFKPRRDDGIWINQPYTHFVKHPKGSIAKLIGRELTWNDEPVKLE